MRNPSLFAVSALAATLSCSTAQAPQADVQAEKSTLMDADRAWSETAADADAFAAYFTEDARFFPPGAAVVTGRSAIRDFASQLLEMPGFSITWTPDAADVSSSGDLGYTTGAYEMSFNDEAGNPVTERGKYVTVWKKQADGQWKVVADIFNADAPPGAAASESGS